MKHYNFDEIIDRRGTNCNKYDRLEESYGNADLIPMPIADMDFRTPDFIVNAIRKRCEHEIFGYTFRPKEYFDCIINWVQYKHHWTIQQEWISYIPGVVKGISFALQCFTEKGDKVIIQPPVYHPFRLVPQKLGREVVYNPLKMVNGVYEMDFDNLESVIDDKCKVLILCSPHNPGGMVWSKDSLIRLAEICSRHGLLVISDEIHSELAFPQYKHHPFATVSEEAAASCITFMAPSKTFNIAGIVSSYCIITNPKIREKFYNFLEASELNDANIFSYIATIAAYTYGAEWLQQMRNYLMENVRAIREFTRSLIPQVKMYEPQASFLVWLDCRELGFKTQQELIDFFVKKAKLVLNEGSMFGPGGEGYMRMNIGCPISTIQSALINLKIAVDNR